jgi:squalene cyclase
MPSTIELNTHKLLGLLTSMNVAQILRAITAGRDFIESVQRPDGSWYGSWGCCFTYASWFGLEGLTSAGMPSDAPAVVRGVRFLLAHQNENGGWGEDFSSCYDKIYAAHGANDYGQVSLATVFVQLWDPCFHAFWPWAHNDCHLPRTRV